MRSVCRMHGGVLRRLDRAVDSLEDARADIAEIKADVKTLVKANSDRREAIGELRGRIIVISALTAVGISGVVSLLAVVLQ